MDHERLKQALVQLKSAFEQRYGERFTAELAAVQPGAATNAQPA